MLKRISVILHYFSCTSKESNTYIFSPQTAKIKHGLLSEVFLPEVMVIAPGYYQTAYIDSEETNPKPNLMTSAVKNFSRVFFY